MMGREMDKNGFMLPLAVFALVLMTGIAVASLLMANDEHRSALAMHESSTAFYAAEAGLNEVYAGWSTIQAQIDSLEPGDALDLGWKDLAGGSRYRALIRRTDTGGQALYTMTIDGRGRGFRGGRKELNIALTAGIGSNLSVGSCCDAALTIRGRVDMDDTTSVSGFDEVPANWDSVCPPPGDDRPGIIMHDTTLFTTDATSWVEGSPPKVLDTSIDDNTFDQLTGDLTWDSLKALSDHTVGSPGSMTDYFSDDVYPRYNADGTCDTSHPLNWGSDDPDDACFDYFPIIVIEGGVEINNIYGQGIVILEWDESALPGEKGGEFDIGFGSSFNGIVLGKGCLEVEEGARFHGAIFIDSQYRNEPLCYLDKDFDMNENAAQVDWSRCAVDRAIGGSRLADYAEGSAGSARFLQSRSFGETFR